MMNEQINASIKAGVIGGGTLTTVGWWTTVDWIAIVGALVVVGTFFVNLTFRRRADRREQERWEIEKKLLLERGTTKPPE